MKKRKNTSVLLGSLLALFILGGAVTVAGLTNAQTIKSESVPAWVNSVNNVTSLKRNGNILINQRLTELDKTQNTVMKNTKITVEQKDRLLTIIGENRIVLNEAKVELQNETSVGDIRNILRSVVNDVRVYSIVIPKVMAGARLFEIENNEIKVGQTLNNEDAKLALQRLHEQVGTKISLMESIMPVDYPQVSREKFQDLTNFTNSYAKEIARIKAIR